MQKLSDSGGPQGPPSQEALGRFLESPEEGGLQNESTLNR